MIKLVDCTKIYSQNKVGIQSVNLVLPSTGIIGILGESGSGKSTLINCLGGLDSFSSGQIYINENKVNNLYDYSTYVFQEFKLLEELSVMENITFSLTVEEEKVDELLSDLGILSIKHSKVSSISGGQRQRVGIGRALIRDVPIIFCDEPTANLDNKTSHEIMSIFKKISDTKLVVVVSHNEGLLKKYTENILYIEEGRVKNNLLDIKQAINNFLPIKKSKLYNSEALKLAINNMKHNKIKVLLTTLFLWLSLTITFLLIGIITINFNNMSYYSYKKNKISYAEFVKYDNHHNNPYAVSISSNIVELFNPDIVNYSDVNFSFEFEEEVYTIHNIWIARDEKYKGLQLNNNEIIVSSDVFEDYLHNAEALINKNLVLPQLELKIIGVLEPEIQNVIVLNNQTFESMNSNLNEPSYIAFKVENQGHSSARLFNPYTSYNPVSLIKGAFPILENEAAIPIQFINNLYPGNDPNEFIGETIGINFLPNVLGIFSGDEKHVVIKETLTITGFTNDGFIFPDEKLSYYASKYGSSRLDNSQRSVISLSYNLNTFKDASKYKLGHVSGISDNVYFVYSMLNNFKNPLIIIVAVFLVLAAFSIINSVSTSILKSKKDLGVLIAFKIRKESLGKIFLIENLISAFFSIVISTVTYVLLLNYLNWMINKEFKINISTIQFNFGLIILSVVICLVFVVMAVAIPLLKVMKKQAIDILFER